MPGCPRALAWRLAWSHGRAGLRPLHEVTGTSSLMTKGKGPSRPFALSLFIRSRIRMRWCPWTGPLSDRSRCRSGDHPPRPRHRRYPSPACGWSRAWRWSCRSLSWRSAGSGRWTSLHPHPAHGPCQGRLSSRGRSRPTATWHPGPGSQASRDPPGSGSRRTRDPA